MIRTRQRCIHANRSVLLCHSDGAAILSKLSRACCKSTTKITGLNNKQLLGSGRHFDNNLPLSCVTGASPRSYRGFEPWALMALALIVVYVARADTRAASPSPSPPGALPESSEQPHPTVSCKDQQKVLGDPRLPFSKAQGKAAQLSPCP